ncbi:MAG TPA: hypothetical protein VN644_23810 [Pyrinomonadaceae bacterium]|nr:hypothetical protein [Pyrinomonadaceae bacterium]
MDVELYKQALFAARMEKSELNRQLKELDNQRAELNKRISSLTDTISGLALLSGEKPLPPPDIVAAHVKGLGLADACRVILTVRDRFSTPIVVRDMLEHVKYDFGDQANPLASIHSILKRFVDSGEAETLDINGKTGYRLKDPDKELMAKLANEVQSEETAGSKKVETKTKRSSAK